MNKKSESKMKNIF